MGTINLDFDETRRPNPSRFTVVQAVVSLELPAGAAGTITAGVGADDNTFSPAGVFALANRVSALNVGGRINQTTTLTFLVPPGHYYQIQRSVNAGNPIFTVNHLTEHAVSG